MEGAQIFPAYNGQVRSTCRCFEVTLARTYIMDKYYSLW